MIRSHRRERKDASLRGHYNNEPQSVVPHRYTGAKRNRQKKKKRKETGKIAGKAKKRKKRYWLLSILGHDIPAPLGGRG